LNNINIFLADDHQIFLDGLSLLLNSEPGFKIMGTALNGNVALSEILKLKPDVALLDMRMPEKDGLQITRILKEKTSVSVIILSMHSDRRFINDAINYGADAYILKNAGKNELINTIKKVLAGEKSFPLANKVINSETQSETFLTPRELDIFRLVINEFTSAQIAAKLSLSQYTVETHRKNIMKKIGTKNSTGWMKYAMDNEISLSE